MRRVGVLAAVVVSLVAAVSAPATGAAATGTTPDFIANGDAEIGSIAGWGVGSFPGIQAVSSSPLDGSYSFAEPSWVGYAVLTQEIDVAAYGGAIADGGVTVTVDGLAYLSAAPIATDSTHHCEIQADVVFYTDWHGGGAGAILEFGQSAPVPTYTAIINLIMIVRNYDTSGGGQVPMAGCAPKFDNVSLTLSGIPKCHGLVATLVGTNNDDVLDGTKHADVIVGRGGADTIDGKGGGDTICAGSGKDTVFGGPGGDTVYGGTGNDHVKGGSGHDSLFGEEGMHDRLIGGKGDDHADGGPGGDDRCVAEHEIRCEV
jgi:Ca2+-binding RTX toxin-like protein